MAGPLPDALRVREVKYGEKSTPEARSRLAREFQAAGRAAEALDLFLLAGDDEGAREIQEEAVREGRPLLLILCQRGGREVTRDEWRKAGEAAYSARRWREAFRCFTAARDDAGLARVREQIPDFEIYVPQGKSQ